MENVLAISITPPPVAVVARHLDGREIWFASAGAALDAVGLRWIGQNIASDFAAPVTRAVLDPRTGQLIHGTEWVMETHRGQRLVYEDFAALRHERDRHRNHRGNFARIGLGRQLAHQVGRGPVPFTGRRTAGHYFRYPSTVNEKRLAVFVMREDGEVAPRGKRSASNIADAWDDLPVRARENRNWKRFRKSQWKVGN